MQRQSFAGSSRDPRPVPAPRSSLALRPRQTIVAWLLGALLVLQLAMPAASMPRPASDASLRLAALAKVVGHAVATCHDDDGGQRPAGDAGTCCPCTLCHAHAAGCLAPAITVGHVRPLVVATVHAYPQPPPRAPAMLLGLSGPRGPPLSA